jgi:hypothetical protein
MAGFEVITKAEAMATKQPCLLAGHVGIPADVRVPSQLWAAASRKINF